MQEIPGFSNYTINEKGEVYSRYVNRLIKPYTNQRGYWRYMLVSDEGISTNILLHRLLAFVFLNLPSLDSDLEVDHEDTDINNNKLTNLKVLTNKQHQSKTLKDKGLVAIEHRYCERCDKQLSYYMNSGSLCNSCKNEKSREDSGITAEIIEYWVLNFSWVRAGKELGLSDNGVRKRYKILTGKDPKDIKKNMAPSSNG